MFRLRLDEIKHVNPHHFNYRIFDSTANSLRVDINKFSMNIEEYRKVFEVSLSHSFG
ncbi:3-oxoacyl-[acyl-carrier-protein] synthase III C-terminal domain-containing protein [Fusibacter paucivorans]|uniref:3-oxoacyl-[acyl-carrier-protein] synthase III C-terminal domain-containing protein n=1 Tax=Fusibacter paucivorans TaxID=76009 RepID=UPI003CCEDE66